ncbi:MAG: hypothetical protein CMJ04_00800 [Pelagibacteraceae bacterium]|nr:hypothetical protein [Pelagibacteraceae bacterium]
MIKKIKPSVFVSDLTHADQGIGASGFPLGASYVYSYAKKMFGNQFDFKLFKMPYHLATTMEKISPKILSFSNYSWNLELGYKFSSLSKKRDPNVITVFGGPNFPTLEVEKIKFLKKKPYIDFYIELEGELGFADLIENLIKYNFDINKLKEDKKKIINTCYLHNESLITGSIDRIKDINIIPSPYLTGALDQFFNLPLIPMIETTRGCPFSCTFCADGLAVKNKINRYEFERTSEELNYIAKRRLDVDELIITDLNFAMYKQDIVTAKEIAKIQKIYSYPTTVDAPAGKNMPQRTIEVASIMKGWSMGGVIQSSDPEVLKSIKRSNISISGYRDLIKFGNTQKSNRTYTEIILGLPKDTKKKHFESLKFGIDNHVNNLRTHQAMLLVGTQMASKEDRDKYGLITKYRTLPGNVGKYKIFGKKHAVAEIEEIVIGSNTLSVEDYLECRIMNLIIKTFYNNSIFDEVHSLLRSMNLSPFDCLKYIKDHSELHTKKIKEIISNFVSETMEDLFDSREQANDYVLSPKIINKYIDGELGTNELFLHSSMLFDEFEDITNLIFQAAKKTIENNSLLSEDVNDYLIELKNFILLRKKNSFNNIDSVKRKKFIYNFKEIHNAEYLINPNSIKKLKNKVEFIFFHNKEQKKYINNQKKLYDSHALGAGRMLQQTDLNLIFRSFDRATV